MKHLISYLKKLLVTQANNNNMETKELVYAKDYIKQQEQDLARYQKLLDELDTTHQKLLISVSVCRDNCANKQQLENELADVVDKANRYSRVFGVEFKDTKTVLEAKDKVSKIDTKIEEVKSKITEFKQNLFDFFLNCYQKEDELKIFRNHSMPPEYVPTYSILALFFAGAKEFNENFASKPAQDYTNVKKAVFDCLDLKVKTLKEEVSFAQKAIRQLEWKDRCLKYCADHSLVVDNDNLEQVISVAMRHHNQRLVTLQYPSKPHGPGATLETEMDSKLDYSDPAVINLNYITVVGTVVPTVVYHDHDQDSESEEEQDEAL